MPQKQTSENLAQTFTRESGRWVVRKDEPEAFMQTENSHEKLDAKADKSHDALKKLFKRLKEPQYEKYKHPKRKQRSLSKAADDRLLRRAGVHTRFNTLREQVSRRTARIFNKSKVGG